jgi:hypothetical protein
VLFLNDALVMIMNCNRQGFLGVVLSHAMQVELAFNFRRFGDAQLRFLFPRLGGEFLIKHLLAQDNAVVANVYPGTGDEFLNFGVRLAAKTAQRNIGRPRH